MFAASKTASVSGGYQISRSLRFNSADSAYLNRTPASATNRKTWTWSGWIKRSNLSASGYFFTGNSALSDAGFLGINFGNGDKLEITGWATTWRLTTQVFRDPSAWYHFVIALDTTQATANNRIRLYVNGSEVTVFDTTNNPAQNADLGVNTASPHYLSTYDGTNNKFNGYMTEVNFIDGQALTPSSFGETNAQTGVWQPKAYSGSYGTNGFYLNFSDNSNTTAATLGKDYSGNGNNWTPNNFSVTAGAGNDSVVDSPTSYGVDTGVGGTVRGNYCTWNPLQQLSSLPSNGNLFVETNGNVGDGAIRNTLGLTSGKWYFEATVSTNYPGNWNAGVIELTGASNAIATSNGNSTSKFAFILGGGTLTWYKKTNSSLTAISPSGCADGTVMSIAVDLDSGKMWVAKNGTWADSGDPSAGTNAQFTSIPSDTYLITAFPYKDGSGNISFNANFGQRPFAYTAPSGYKALCTQNLPTPTIGATTATQAGKFFNPVLYTGNGTTQTVSGVGFQPDWIWVKRRTVGDHFLVDVVRGGNKSLASNKTNAETTEAFTVGFDADGFSLPTADTAVNGSGTPYVAWNWKANGTGSTNTAGSITSTVSANTTSGFSVVTYTGTGSVATVGHGLGVAPYMVIVKRRDGVADWATWHTSIGTQVLFLNLTNAATSGTAQWNGTTPTSSVFTVSTSSGVNGSGGTYVAYCFAPVSGYSAFGSYTGNGSADGPFLYLGFTPKYILIKKSSSSGTDWRIITINTSYLSANTSSAEYDSPPGPIRGMSNGVKVVGTGGDINENGATFIYAAFASYPFKYALAQSA